MLSIFRRHRVTLKNHVNSIVARNQFTNQAIDLKCKSAIVTGGARGSIGYYIAQSLLDHGVQNVLLVHGSEKKCKEATEQLNQRYGGPRAFPCKCDISCMDDMEVIFNRMNVKHLDILINSSNIDDGTNIQRTLDTNLKGIVNGTVLGFKYLREGGCIINVSSIHGLQPFYGSPIYSGTQFFSTAFTRAMGNEYYFQKNKIKVMALCPGVTNSECEREKRMSGMPFFDELSHEQHCCFPQQQPEEVGNCVITMLELGENGSVWVSEDSECYQCVIPDREDFIRLPLKKC